VDWWIWVAGGMLLVVLELVTPTGFFIVFFGLGAITVGVLTEFALLTSWWLQWLFFSAFSLAYLLLFRGRLQSRFENPPSSTVDSLIGVLAVAREALPPGVVGRVEVRGAAWSARNTSAVTLEAGQRCRVVSVDGLTLAVQPE
jgi:membrane protein implicated in regulation of membrane protease activity